MAGERAKRADEYRPGQVVAFTLSNLEVVYVPLLNPVYRGIGKESGIDSWIIPNPDFHKAGTWQVKPGDIRPLTAREGGVRRRGNGKRRGK